MHAKVHYLDNTFFNYRYQDMAKMKSFWIHFSISTTELS